MLKADVLAILEANKDKPVIIGLSDEGQVIYSGVDGHWLFTKGDNLVEIKTVTMSKPSNGITGIAPQVCPFSIYTTPFDVVNYVEAFIKNEPGAIATAITGLTPVGTAKTIDAIQKEIESNSARKAMSPRGNLNTKDVEPGSSYGQFEGYAISTSKEGIPKYMKDKLIGN